MAAHEGQQGLLHDLVERLESLFRVTPAATLDEALEVPTPAASLRRPQLRVAEQFDVDPQLLIVERELGVLGFVDFAPDENGPFEQAVERLIDRAAYVSHLCRTHSSARTHAPWTVEVVLLVPKPSAPRLGQVLRDIARETSYLYEVGVNVLEYAPGENPQVTTLAEPRLRRAFPWLLTATRAWFADEQAWPKRGNQRRAKPARLDQLALTNYRLPGRRELKLAGADDQHEYDLREDFLHVVFGHNGSGKSSFVEALEYVLCGHVQRFAEIEEDEEFRRTVRNRHSAATAARIEVHSGRRRAVALDVDTRRLEDAPLGTTIHRGSFLLDQTMIDRLTRATTAERTRIFLEAYFASEEVLHREEHNERVRQAHKSWQALPARLRKTVVASRDTDPAAEQVLASLHWIAARKARPAPEQIAECLPAPLDALRELGKVHPDLRAVVEAWGDGPTNFALAKKLLAQLDDALRQPRAVAAQVVDDLAKAGRVLADLESWHVPPSAQPQGLIVPVLNAWLRCTALADLAELHLQLARSINNVMATGVSLGWDQPVGLFQRPLTEDEIDQLRNQGEQWRESAAEHRANLPTERGRDEPTSDSAGDTSTEPPADVRDLRVLDRINRFAAMLFDADDSVPLGKSIANAFVARQEQPFGSLRIGEPGWATKVREALKAVEDAYKKLNKALKATASERLELLQQVRESYAALQSSDELLASSFLHMIGAPTPAGEPTAPAADAALTPTKPVAEPPARSSVARIYDALNEVLALFTPARWTYDDIQIALEQRAGTQDQPDREVFRIFCDRGPHEERVQADLLFNTAQLTTFALAMFLLAARRVDNPLRLLVLDDPLQNMDELTVAVTARGLARLLRIWTPPTGKEAGRKPNSTSDAAEPWQLLILLHGEQSLASFRRELPTTYHWLPFQSPAPDGHDEPVDIHRDRLKSGMRTELQELRQIMKLRG